MGVPSEWHKSLSTNYNSLHVFQVDCELEQKILNNYHVLLDQMILVLALNAQLVGSLSDLAFY